MCCFFLLGFVLFPYDVSWVFLSKGLGFPCMISDAIFCFVFCILSSVRFPRSPSSPPIHFWKFKIMFLTSGKYFLSQLIFFFNACVVFSSCCCAGCSLTLLWFWNWIAGSYAWLLVSFSAHCFPLVSPTLNFIYILLSSTCSTALLRY